MSGITGDQRRQLMQQMTAFRLLATNQEIPSVLLQSILVQTGSSAPAPEPERAVSSLQKRPERALELDLEKELLADDGDDDDEAGLDGDGEVYHLRFADDGDEPAMPLAVRVRRDAGADAREYTRQLALAQRLDELQQTRHLTPAFNDRSQHREFFELRLLRLQKSLRSHLVGHIRSAALSDAAEDTGRFRRPARLPVKMDQRATEGEEPAVGSTRRQFVDAVLSHGEAFRKFHNGMRSNVRKVARAAALHVVQLQRRQQQQQERAQRDRLKALKANDEEGYMKLLQETKNERLTMLIQQTDKYLDKIRELVAAHQMGEEEEIAVDPTVESNSEDTLLKKESEATVPLPEMTGKEEKKEENIERKENEEEEEEEENKKEDTVGEKKDKAMPIVPSSTENPSTAPNISPTNISPTSGSPKNTTTGVEGGGEKKPKAQYYTTAHRVEEEVEQPTMMKYGSLKPYQLAGLKWLVSLYNNNLNGILADEMGLGKTIQSIALLTYLFERKGVAGPFLVATPLSTMENWRLEFERWAPELKVVVYSGVPSVRKALYAEHIASGRFHVLLTTYDYVIRDKGPLGTVKWNHLIVDEGHRLKNHSSKLHVVFSKHFHTKHRLLLTGTPLQNNLAELWSLLNFLLPTIFNSVANFEEWFNAPFENLGESVQMTEEEALLIINRLHKVLRPFLLRRVKKQVEHQLPPKVERIVKCAPSALQEVMYKQMTEEGAVLVADLEDPQDAGKGGATKGMMNALMQLRKICNHPYLFHDEYPIDENLVRTSGKFDLLDHVLPKLFSCGHRVLMFSQFTSTMSLLEDYFMLRGLPYLRLDGTTKSEDRGDMLHKFNAPDSPYNIFILSTRAGGLGLNLQTADTVVLFDSDWNPHMDMQAQDRAHRIGQKNTVLVLRLVMVDSVEEKILERAEYKMGIDAKVIEAGMFDRSSNASKRRSMLCELLKTDRNAKEGRHRVPSDDEINRLIARSEDERVRFARWDEARIEERRAKWLAAGHAGDPKPRLMAEAELPRSLTDPALRKAARAAREAEKNASLLDLGRGMRVRKDVNYSENASDAEFLRAIQYSSDSDREHAHSAQIRRRKPVEDDEEDLGVELGEEADSPLPRKKNEPRKPQFDEEEDVAEDPLEEEEEPHSTPPVRRGRGRPPSRGKSSMKLTFQRPSGGLKRPRPDDDGSGWLEHEDVDDEGSSLGFEARRNGRSGVLQTAAMLGILDELRELHDDYGRRRLDLFMVLPSRRDYPDYYQIIRKPIDIKTIRSRIRSLPAYSWDDLERDVVLLFTNATVYNQEGSQIYIDALFLLSEFRSRLAAARTSSPRPEIPSFEEEDPVMMSF